MAGKKSLMEQIEEQKRKAGQEAEHILREYQNKANEFRSSINRVLSSINENAEEARKHNADMLRALEEEHDKRKALEETKSQAIHEKSAQFNQSMVQRAVELDVWINDVRTSAEEHHEKLTYKEQKYRAKLEELKRNTPEEHLRKAEEHKTTFESRRELEERTIRRIEEKLTDVRGKIESERKAAVNQMNTWCGERSKQLEVTKRDTFSKIDLRFQEIHSELTKAAFDLGVVER